MLYCDNQINIYMSMPQSINHYNLVSRIREFEIFLSTLSVLGLLVRAIRLTPAPHLAPPSGTLEARLHRCQPMGILSVWDMSGVDEGSNDVIL